MKIIEFKNQLQYSTLSGLKLTKRKTTHSGRLIISETVFKFLKSKGVNGRFKPNPSLFGDLKLQLCRQLPESLVFTEPTHIIVKVGKKKELKCQFKDIYWSLFVFVRIYKTSAQQ